MQSFGIRLKTEQLESLDLVGVIQQNRASSDWASCLEQNRTEQLELFGLVASKWNAEAVGICRHWALFHFVMAGPMKYTLT